MEKENSESYQTVEISNKNWNKTIKCFISYWELEYPYMMGEIYEDDFKILIPSHYKHSFYNVHVMDYFCLIVPCKMVLFEKYIINKREEIDMGDMFYKLKMWT